MEIQWPLALFTLAVCAASGMFALQGVLVLRGEGRRAYLPALAVEFALVVIGGIASFFHLEHWSRIFNGFGHLSSVITHEMIGLVILVAAIFTFFVVNRRESEGADLPKWLGVVAIVVGALMVFISANAYNMPARPVWGGFGTFFYYFAGAFLTGSALLWTVMAIKDEDAASALLAKLTFVAGIVAAIAVAVFAFTASQAQGFSEIPYYFDPVTPTIDPPSAAQVVSSVLYGGSAWLYWGVALGIGSVVAAVLGFMGTKKASDTKIIAASAAACALVGGLAFRAVFFMLGVSVFGLF
jgi:DMSO reductase anchor subunit